MRSVLFGPAGPPPNADGTPEPDYFHDLNLDQVAAELDRRRPGYDLIPFFRHALHDPAQIRFRQEVFRDLDGGPARTAADEFTAAMRGVRDRLRHAETSHYAPQEQRWFLDAALAYCAAVTEFGARLAAVDPRSEGLRNARDDLAGYLRSDGFRVLQRDARQVRDGLDRVRYNMLLRGDKITIGRYDDEPDYGVQVVELFARFQQDAPAREHRGKLSTHTDMDHIEAAVVELVGKLYPELFADLAAFAAHHRAFLAADVARLDRELQFYLGYLDCLRPLREAGLATCYPAVSAGSKQLNATETYDLALAIKLAADHAEVVVNDVYLTGPERILVISGPNQGGKTTLSRAVGQLHHLAALGCPVPGRDVRTLLPDTIFTHYQREEHLDSLVGKLQDELQRVHAVLERATTNSVIVVNEIFTSTTLDDARLLSERILSMISDLDAVCVCVSFIDELSRLNEKTVSMVSTVEADDPATRTFKLVRQPADGRAYALAIARKYRLTYEQLTERLGA